MQFKTLVDAPILHTKTHASLGQNINGPSVTKVPDWVENPLGKYYLYFAHHSGTHIRLAYADSIPGPWHIHEVGALHLSESLFCKTPPKHEDTHPDVLAMIAEGIEGDYPHIASPDIHVDNKSKRVLMYFHGRIEDGTQHTRLATSSDGLHFTVEPELLGQSYFRVFEYENYFYAIALAGKLYRSADGRSNFEFSHAITPENFRHCALLIKHGKVFVLWSRAHDKPERLLISELDTKSDWRNWTLQNTRELHRPLADWEGANEPLVASRYGAIMHPVNQLRDPCVFEEDGKVYVFYSVQGEQGIGVGELEL